MPILLYSPRKVQALKNPLPTIAAPLFGTTLTSDSSSQFLVTQSYYYGAYPGWQAFDGNLGTS